MALNGTYGEFEMKLESDKYLVTTDGDQFILQSKRVIKDSPLLKDKTKIGQLALSSEKKYYGSLSSLFYGMVKYQLLEDDEITSFEQILDLITNTKKELGGE